MAAKVGTLQCPGSTGTQAITGLGFAPDAVILFTSALTADGTGADAALALGLGTSSTARHAVGIHAEDALATAAAGVADSNDHVLRLWDSGADAMLLEADLDSLDADGFTLDWTTVLSGADVHYLALGGGIDAAEVMFTPLTTTGSKSVTGVGFQPAAVVAIGQQTGADAALNADAAIGLFAGDGTTEGGVSLYADHSTVSADGGRYATASKFLGMISNVSAAVSGEADFTSFDADGMTYNVTDAYLAASRFGGLFLAGIDLAVGTLTVPAGTGTQAITGLGFAPDAVLLFGAHAAFAAPATGLRGFVGAATGSTERAAVALAMVQASDPTEADRASRTDACVVAITAGTPTVDLVADLDSLDADGFTLDWTTVGTGAGVDQVVWMAFGATAGGGANPRRPAPVLIW